MSSYINDSESAGELVRLIKQSLLLDACRPSVPRAIAGRPLGRVLDIGCGPGSWALTMAHQFPEASVIGVDRSQRMVDYATARVSVLPENNVCFEVKDALNPADGPFEKKPYDFIHLSLASSWVPNREAWKQLLSDCFAMTRPGGAVAVTEWELALTTSVALNRLQTITLAAFQASGRTASGGQGFGVVTKLGRLLREVGFEPVQVEVDALDFSYHNEKENMAWRDLIPIFLYETKAFLLGQGVTTAQELEEVVYQAQIELYQEDFCGIAPLYTFTGIKPERKHE